MSFLHEAWRLNQGFVETGGWVLLLIAAVTFLMWMLILERLVFFATGHRQAVRDVTLRWTARADRVSWNAHQIRRAMIASVELQAQQSVGLIKTLVALCPLLGLLGTVTGMIEVFDAMAATGGGNVRAMASGVSRATIPTMAGMVASLSGVIFSIQIDRFAKNEVELLSEHLVPEASGAQPGQT